MACISFKDVSFEYPGGVCALENACLEIERGESVAMIGRNGAGKTTAAKLMNGLLKPSAGVVTIGGMDTRQHSAARISRLAGYVFQNPGDQIFHSSVFAEVDFGPKMLKFGEDKRKALVEYALKITGLESVSATNPYDLPLSARRFVTIASVLAADAPIVIFDEPTAGQDINGIKRLAHILGELREKGKTAVTITHDMEFAAENFSRVVVLADKKIIASGAPRDIFWDFAALSRAGLEQPHISRLCRRLGLPGNIVTVGEAADAVTDRLKV